MKKRAIVTGGAGFIGSYVVKELLKQSYKVVVVDNMSKGKRITLDPSVTYVEADVCDYKTMLSIIEEGDVVFHLAALTSVPLSLENPLPYHHTNIVGTYTVLEASRVKLARGVIFSSSASVYGNQEGEVTETTPPHPESPYALQKLLGEQLCESYAALYGMACISLRYFNVYGKGNNEEGSYAPVTARFLKAKRENTPLSITGDGTQSRDFIHVEDVARINVEATELLLPKTYEVINVSSGASVTIIDIAMTIGGTIEYTASRNEIQHSQGSTKKREALFPSFTIKPFDEGLRELL